MPVWWPYEKNIYIWITLIQNKLFLFIFSLPFSCFILNITNQLVTFISTALIIDTFLNSGMEEMRTRFYFIYFIYFIMVLFNKIIPSRCHNVNYLNYLYNQSITISMRFYRVEIIHLCFLIIGLVLNIIYNKSILKLCDGYLLLNRFLMHQPNDVIKRPARYFLINNFIHIWWRKLK